MILGHLETDRGTSPTELARHLGVRGSTLTAALARLEGLGYITRRARAVDRRRRDVHLAEPGVRAMQASSVLDTALLRSVLARLSPAETKRVVLGLRVLARAASAAMTDDVFPKRHRNPTRLEQRP